MLSGKPASIAATWAEPKLATRRAEEPKPKKAKKAKSNIESENSSEPAFLSTLENKGATDTAKGCLKEWKVNHRT